MTTKEVTKKHQGGSALATYDYGMEADAGYENVQSTDLVLPFLQVLQSNSPQVDGEDGLPGAKAGVLHNTVTNELFDGKKGVVFVPACTEHLYVEWVRRDAGGGFVGVHAVDSEFVQQAAKLSREAGQPFGKVFTAFNEKNEPAGNQLTETFYVYGVAVSEMDGRVGEVTPVVLAFTSTKIGVYKRWMTSLKLFMPKAGIPLCAHQTRVTTVKQEKRGQSFYNVVLAPANGDLASSLLNPKVERDAVVLDAAKSVREMVRSGLARIAYETQANDGGATTAAGGEGEEAPPF